MQATTIYLVRHAHAITAPGEKRALSPQGRAGAEHVAALLRERPIVAIYSSPSRRVRQTLKPLAQALGLAIEEHDELREPGHSAAPDAEAQRRAVALITTLAHRHAGQQIAVGTHGNLLALILQHYDPTLDTTVQQRLSLPDLYQLTLGEGAHLTRLWDAGDRFAMP